MGADYDDLPDGVVIADDTTTVIEVNAAAAHLIGRSKSELVGRPLSEVMALRDVEGREWWPCVAPYTGLTTRSRLVEGSWFVPDGGEVLVTGRLVRAHRGGPVSAVIISLRDARARRRVDRSRSDLVATVAHELRSPLTGVKGFTATLLSKWERFSDSQRRLMLQTVDADADRLTRLIAELLDVARIDSNRLQLRPQPIDLATTTRKLLESMPVGERAMDLQLHQVPEVWVDPDKYTQILTNLVENATRHGEGTITVGVAPAADVVELWVQDEGAGIPEDLRRRVFTKFWRYGHRGGTGLGLYIVNGLVEAHGGSVSVGSGRAGGARMQVRFPLGEPVALG